jgi:uncharacterized protein (TIGR02996 family)
MALSPDLLAALRTTPQDPERFLVLADRLQSEGDPRGELIALGAARARAAEPEALAQAEERYLREHARALLGRLWSAPSSYILGWELGFIRHAMLWVAERDEPVGVRPADIQPRRRTGKLSRRTADLLELESSGLLETLTLGMPRSSVQVSRMLDAVAEVAASAPPTLHLLQLRDLIGDEPAGDWEPAMLSMHLPDYEPGRMRQLTWRGRPLTLSADTFPLDKAVDALGAWE